MNPGEMLLPSTILAWSLSRGPLVQAVALGLATFVQEDAPTLAAAALAGTGRLSLAPAWLGCLLGIWIGDVLLYFAARGLGDRFLTHRWVRRWARPEAVGRCSAWFAQRGIWLLVTSRFVPGTRLPTYLAAGLLRVPFGRFLAVTGAVVMVWTALIFGVAQGAAIGLARSPELARWSVVGVLVVVGVIVAAVRTVPRVLRTETVRDWQTALGRWCHWEFWPSWLFYAPVAVNGLRLAMRHGGLTTPTAANPGIATGGIVGESKFATLRELQERFPDFTAETWFLPESDGAARFRILERILADHAVGWPFILKPDVGQRGLGVKRIERLAEARDYLDRTGAALVVQRYAPGPGEAGVFYYRFPDEPRGRIFAITEKIFPVVTGDGRRTVEELIRSDLRARWIAARYLARLRERRHEIPCAGETVELVRAGNHAQGCIFLDGSRWLTPELEDRIDLISRGVPGFFVGRYDVRFGSELELRGGRGFRIVELNGASAEATHIYDARRSLRSAYVTLFRQWELVFAIGAANRARGTPVTPAGELWQRWRESARLAATYPLAD